MRVGLYLLHGEPLLCMITGESKSKLRIKDEKGREVYIPEGRIIIQGIYKGNLGDLRCEVEKIVKEIDMELLYEALQGREGERFHISELSSIYFGEDNSFPAEVALFMVLYEDKIYFKKWKDFTFSPRTPEEREMAEKEIRRKKEEEVFVNKVLSSLRNDTEGDEKKLFIEKLLLFVENREVLSEKDIRLIERILKGYKRGDIKEVAVQILKKEGLIKNEMEELFFIKGIKTRFTKQVERLAREVSSRFSIDPASREDLTSIFTFTIDDEDTLEIDDAVSYINEGGSEIVFIHISDLSPIVSKDDPIDREAFKRGTTIYTPYGVFPMIPGDISYNISSLIKGKERYALTYKFVFSNGELKEWSIFPSVIKVDRKYSYDEVDRILKGEERSEEAGFFKRLFHIASILKGEREKKGGFFLPRREMKVRKKDDDITIKIIDPLSPSRLLISEFMILANYVSSKLALEEKIPVIYRIQQPPDGEVSVNGMVYQEDLPIDTLKNIFKLIKPSQLSLHPSLHWGLGLDTYIQVTSPIRRYSDMVLQRQLVSYLLLGKPAYDEMELMKVIALAEDTYKDVKNMERKITEGVVKEYFLKNTGPFNATVKDKISRGYLVSPMDLPIRLPMITEKSYNFGDRIKVVSEKVGDDGLIFREA